MLGLNADNYVIRLEGVVNFNGERAVREDDLRVVIYVSVMTELRLENRVAVTEINVLDLGNSLVVEGTVVNGNTAYFILSVEF